MIAARRTLAGALGLGLALLSSAGGRAAQERPTDQAMTTAVLVDVVVRDRQGRPVTDLSAEDFEIREDEAPQTVGSFTRVSRGGGIGVRVGLRDPGTTLVGPGGTPSPGSESESGSRAPQPAATALVFDALSADAVALCQRAALDYVPRNGRFDSRVAVYAAEPGVRLLQPYTDDPARVRQAVRLVLPTGTTLREVQAERLARLRERRDQLDGLADPGAQAGAGGASLGAGNATAIGETEVQKRLVQSELRALRSFEALDRDQRGFGTTGALATVVRSLAEMPGRKTLVFFSEGLPASPVLQARLQAVVEAANRVNVTIYAVDASGLRALSGTADTRIEVQEAGKERLRQSDSMIEPTEQPVMRILERTEDLLRFDSQSGLARLAEGTGGFLFRDTNDLRQAFQRIDEDARFHYLLTYVPSNQALDGRFRTIGVRVKRPGLRVFARKGYRAPRRPTLPAFDYETPALAALNGARLPADFPFTSAVLHFPERGRAGRSPLIVRVKTDVLAFDETTTPGAYGGQATIVVRVRDASGDVVEKVSQQYQLSGRRDELEAARRGDILFYREPTLPSGVYTVEAVVHDGVANRASARVSTLEVPPPLAEDGGLSSIVLVRRTERVAAGEARPDSPLLVDDLLFYPNAGEPLSRGEDRELAFFYTLHAARDAAARPSAEIELRRSGRIVAQAPAQLGAADDRGRIWQVSRLPLDGLPNGTYELRVVARAGARTIARSAFFTVTP